MIETIEVSGWMVSSNWLRSIRPLDWTGKWVTSKPSCCNDLYDSSIHLCSYTKIQVDYI